MPIDSRRWITAIATIPGGGGARQLERIPTRMHRIGGGEVVSAFLPGESVDCVADSAPARVGGAGGGFAEQGLELGEGQLDRIDVGVVGREKAQLCSLNFDGGARGGALCAGRLSTMTMSPRRSVGASTCVAQAANHSPFIGPSSTSGAVMPESLNARR